MSKEITISFTVNTNDALLLQTLHDWLTRPRGVDPFESMQDSIVFMGHFPWLVDEIADAVLIWDDFVSSGVTSGTSSGAVKILIEHLKSE